MANPTPQGIDYLKTHPELLSEFNERFESNISTDALDLLISGEGTSDQLLESYFGDRIRQEDQQRAVDAEVSGRIEAESKKTAPEIQEAVEPLGEAIMGPLSRLMADETDESALIEPAAPFTSPPEWKTPFGRPLYQDRRTKTQRAADRGVDVGWGETNQGQRLQSIIAGVPGDSINYSIPYVLDREFQLPPWKHEYNIGKEEHTKGWQFNHPITNQLTLFEDPTQIDTEDFWSAAKEELAITTGQVLGTVATGGNYWVGGNLGMAITYGTYRANQLADLYDEGVLDPKQYKNYVTDVLPQVIQDVSWVVGGSLTGDALLNVLQRVFMGRSSQMGEEVQELVEEAYNAYMKGDVGGPEAKEIFGPSPATAAIALQYSRERAKMLEEGDPLIMQELDVLQKKQWWRNKDKVEQDFRAKVNNQVTNAEELMRAQSGLATLLADSEFRRNFSSSSRVRERVLEELASHYGLSQEAKQMLLTHPLFMGSAAARQQWGSKALEQVEKVIGGNRVEIDEGRNRAEQAVSAIASQLRHERVPPGQAGKALDEAVRDYTTIMTNNRTTAYETLSDYVPENITFDVAPLAVYLEQQMKISSGAVGEAATRRSAELQTLLGELAAKGELNYRAIADTIADYSRKQGEVWKDNYGQGRYYTEMLKLLREDVLKPQLGALPDPDGSVRALQKFLDDMSTEEDAFARRVGETLLGDRKNPVKPNADMFNRLSALEQGELDVVYDFVTGAHTYPHVQADRLSELQNALKGAYYEKVIKGNTGDADKLARAAEDFFDVGTDTGVSNRRLWNTFLPERADEFIGEGEAGLGQIVKELQNWKGQLARIDKRIKQSKEFQGLNLNEPEKFFEYSWKPGNISRTEKLFKILTDQAGRPVDPGLMEAYRAYIARHLMSDIGLKEAYGRGAKGFIDPIALGRYLDGEGKTAGYADQLGVLFGDNFVTGLRNLQQAAELSLARGAKEFPSKIQLGNDYEKAMMDLTRAYVGLFTRAGRVVTAGGRIMHRSRTGEFKEDLLDMSGLVKRIQQGKTLDAPYLRSVIQSLGGIYSASLHVHPQEEDMEGLFAAGEEEQLPEHTFPKGKEFSWGRLTAKFPVAEEDPSFQEFRDNYPGIIVTSGDTEKEKEQRRTNILRSMYNKYMTWRKSERNRLTTEPEDRLPAPRPRVAPPPSTSQLQPEMFEPRQPAPMAPQQIAQPAPMAPPQGQPTQTAMLPPSMRDPSSLLGQMAQQRQPMQMSDGGWVDSTDIGKEAKALGGYRMDSGVSVPWNRQHYGESPADIRAKIQHMRTNTSGIMSKISVGKGNRP